MKITAIGIDISKDHLDIAVRPTGERWRVTYSPEQLPALLTRLQALAPERIVLEATGGLEILLATELAAAGLPVVVLNPRQARDFAKATGQLAKTDPVDADVLAHFGEALKPDVRPLPDEQTRALEALLTRRRQLIEMLVAEKNRHAALSRQPKLQKGVAEHIDWLNRRIADLDYLSAQAFGWREGVVLVWAGMRGAVTLAAAQSLPADTPQRALLILIAFLVAAGTLLIQGGTLRWLVKILGLARSDPDELHAKQHELRQELGEALAARLADNSVTKPDGTTFSPVTLDWAQRVISSFSTTDDQRSAEGTDIRSERGQLRLALIELQREELLRIRDLGTYPSSVLEDTLTQLDADQLSLELRTGTQ